MIKYFKKSLSKKISLTSLQWVLVILSVSNLLIYFGVTQIFLERDRYNTEQATEVVRELLSKETSLTEEKLLDLLEQYNATVSLVEEGNKNYIFFKEGGIDDVFI